MMHNPTERFSTRVENYIRYRPAYPPAVLDLLKREIHLTPTWTLADLGSGSGLSAELFLNNGNTVIGVEPNAPMREAAERLLAPHYPNFQSVNGTAEATALPAASIDCIIAAQAFHWFDSAAARTEAQRILRTSAGAGYAILLWNSRRLTGTPFLEAYERLLADFGTDFQQIRHENVDPERLAAFLGPNYDKATLPNSQRLDLVGLRGRIVSSSYIPNPGQPRHEELLEAINQTFAAHQSGGAVELLYNVEIYWSRLV
jgi:SAM-dependent methyltransferase